MKKKNKLMLFVTTAALMISLMIPSFASAAIPVFPTNVYSIMNMNSRLMLTVYAAQTYDGARIVQWNDGYIKQNYHQRWIIQYLGMDGNYPYYKITNYNSGKALDVPGGTSTWGTTIEQWSWNGGQNQQWYIVPESGGSYSIMNRKTKNVLDVYSAATYSGANVVQWGYNGGSNQKWYIEHGLYDPTL